MISKWRAGQQGNLFIYQHYCSLSPEPVEELTLSPKVSGLADCLAKHILNKHKYLILNKGWSMFLDDPNINSTYVHVGNLFREMYYTAPTLPVVFITSFGKSC